MNGDGSPSRETLGAMARQLLHRGPDGLGEHLEGPVALTHTRLSVIDLERGQQPIRNEDGTVWVVFNGEIFNYIELREELKACGHQFHTDTDTEVLVHLYEDHGPEFLHLLNGQFAFALWDSSSQRLMLARDRVGIHPLFYCQTGGELWFASEVKALLPVLERRPRLDVLGFDQIMTFWGAIPPRTAFEGIRQLLPGEYILANTRLQHHIYWDWNFPSHSNGYDDRPVAQQAESLHDLLLDATRLRLRADVPVGAYLSGGLDSSALSVLMQRSGARLRTFSLQFESGEHDESDYQSLMLQRLGGQHSASRVSDEDIAENLVRTVWHTESPILRTAPVPMMLLSKLVRRQGYKVVMTGEGADEVLGGYDLFKEAKIRHFWARFPESRLRPLLLKRLYPYLEASPTRAQAYLQAFFGKGISDPDLPHFSHVPRWTTTAKCKNFWSQEMREHVGPEDTAGAYRESLPREFDSWHPFNRAQYIEAKTLMAAYLLCSQGDRMPMSNSIEARFPYLDHRLIEFANRVPPRFKMRGLIEKYLLKVAMADELPSRILDRHKQPYRAPDIPAVMTAPGEILVNEYLSAKSIRRAGYFDPVKVGILLRKSKAGKAIGYADNMAFIGILSTQIWHELFVENSPAANQYSPDPRFA